MRVEYPERCVHCAAPLESPVGCRECHTVFPSTSAIDHFMRLGMPRTFRLDPTELERRFLAWSRELHPDFFQGRPPQEQELSLELSAKLNDAYATLKDPFRRAEYLLGLFGGPSASQQRQMPPSFLERVLEIRMAIEDARNEGGEAAACLRRELEADRRACMDRIEHAFAALEANPSGDRLNDLTEIRNELNAFKYLDGMLRELDEEAH